MSNEPQALTAIVIAMPAGPGYFPATDERAGAYKDGQILSVPDDIPQAKAEALIASGHAKDLNQVTQPTPAPPAVEPDYQEGE